MKHVLIDILSKISYLLSDTNTFICSEQKYNQPPIL